MALRSSRPLPSLFVLLAFCTMRTSAQTANEPQAGASTIAQQIDRILTDPALAGGIQGTIVQSLKDGRVWYQRNPDLYFMPASNQKLLTSSAALHLLGPDWRYRSRLLMSGDIDCEGALSGDLYLKGSGDPTLMEADLNELVEGVKTAGIRRIKGLVVGDDGRFDSERYGPGWSWDYLQDYYAAPVSALNLNRNVVTLNVASGTERAVVTMRPIPYFELDNRAFTEGRVSSITIRRELGTGKITATGSVANTGVSGIRVAVLDPAHYTAAVLKDKLVRAGIAVEGEAISGRAPGSGLRELAVHDSAPLAEILKLFNKPSDNLIGECLLKTLGAEKGREGSLAAGRQVAMRWFREIGIPENGFEMADGSGLSRLNVVTPRSLARLLAAMYSHPHSRVFVDSLPVAGVDGTLRNRMKGTAAEGNVRAKTGYIGAVSSLSGYVTTKDGEPLVFVILMNNHRARNAEVTPLQNRIAEALASWTGVP